MGFEVESVSPAGARLVELADKHAAECALTAERYDRENAFPYPHWAALRASGLLGAAVPVDLGGTGVSAVRDLVAGVNRLARGDAAIAIGAAMHLTAFWYLARTLAGPAAGTDATLAARLRLLLRRCARGHSVACVAISEAGNPIGRPDTAAEPVAGGYRVNGRKAFCTNSPVATLFLTMLRVRGHDGGYRLGFAVVPRDTPGLSVRDNWDGLGMRASGSGDVEFTDCLVPADLVVDTGPLGELPDRLRPLVLAGVLVLSGAFLGIAEQAQAIATGSAGGRRPDRDAQTAAAARALVGENEIDLAVSRAVLVRAATALDEYLGPADAGTAAAGRHEGLPSEGLMSEVQCASTAVKRAAIATVDRALTVSGGSGYRVTSPLARLYRDVRAGPFMQPYSALQAVEYIGRVRLESVQG